MATMRQPKHDRFGRIRLGARLDIRGTGREAGNAYRRQSAWEDPTRDDPTMEAEYCGRRAPTIHEMIVVSKLS